MAFTNCYDDTTRAEAYASLEFANTYYLAFRDLPAIFSEHVSGKRALDFGCGTGRSTRFLRRLGFQVIGVDIAPKMIAKARELDKVGDYRVVENDDLSALQAAAFDLVLSAFTFDNIPGWQTKVRLFGNLGALLDTRGKVVNIVSTPEIYVHEWASFSTKDYPENLKAETGDVVRIITTEFADRRPAEDVLWTHEAYDKVYSQAGLEIVAHYKPLATGKEPYHWVNETVIAPWAIYVLGISPPSAE
ncbi:MAG TPA: class I SAM-dependent methyltransferase [Terriglobales bacterium]|nr:class I SAM-dependent methyltransferase [Terriglobales bacterium]